MGQLQVLLRGIEIQPAAVLDIALTALLIYGLFSLIRGTRAVRLVIGVTVVYGIYVLAQFLGLQLLSQILQAGAVVGLLAIVVVFQPELRRALERIGHVGSLGWLLSPGSNRDVERVAGELARAAVALSARRQGALIVIERETGLGDTAETGVMLHADLSAELMRTIFTPLSPLHDGAVVIRGARIVAARVVLPLSEATTNRERLGTRHLAGLGITEQTDALALVVSEENGSVSLMERGRILRNLDEERLRTALAALLRSGGAGRAGLSFYDARPSWPPRLTLRPSRARRAAAARRGLAGPGGGEGTAGAPPAPSPSAVGPAAAAARDRS